MLTYLFAEVRYAVAVFGTRASYLTIVSNDSQSLQGFRGGKVHQDINYKLQIKPQHPAGNAVLLVALVMQ